MALNLKINGVNKNANWFLTGLQVGQVRFSRMPGGRGVGEFKLYDLAGSTGYRPTIGQSAELLDVATSILNGRILDVSEGSLSALDTATVITTITVADQQRLPGEMVYTKTYASGAFTLKQILQDLITSKLGAAGVTLDGTQVNGPTFGLLEFNDQTLEAILNQLQALSGYVWRISPALVLKMIAPAGESSGLTLSDSAGSVQGQVTLRKARSRTYANRIVLKAGTGQRFIHLEQHNGDGVTRRFALDVDVVALVGALQIDAGPTFFPVGIFGVDDMPWTFDVSTNELVQRVDQAIIAVGHFIQMSYNALYPIVAIAQDAAAIAANGGVAIERIIAAPDVFDKSTAQSLATAELARALASPWTVTVRHRAGLAWPGQTVALSFAARNISGTYMVLTVDAEDDVDGALVYTFTCLEGSQLQETWLDYFKGAGGGSSGSSTISGAPVITTVVASGIGGTGTVNKLPKWATSGSSLVDSLVSDDGTTVTVGAPLAVTGAATLNSTLNVTGVTTLAATVIGGHVTPSLSDTYDLGSPFKIWRQAYISQLNATLFAKETQTLYGGWLSVSKNAGVFLASVASARHIDRLRHGDDAESVRRRARGRQ
jgi:hypothetical protein